MGFCESIEKALKCKAGIYDLKGNFICGTNIGFCYTEDISSNSKFTCINCTRVIVSVNCLLSQDAINLIRLFAEKEYNNEAAYILQPLEYIIKNNVSYESLKGRFEGYTALYLKCSENIDDVLFNIYSGCDVEFVKDENGIYMIKKFDDVDIEADSIINGVRDEKGINIIIGSGRNAACKYTIKHSAEHAKISAVLAGRLGFKSGHFNYEKMVIYNLINSLSNNMTEELLNSINDSFFDVLKDRELINTAEEFLKCDLNISEASRRLYIHRNTLLYRLEKIKTLTGFDIKSFEEAVIFKLLLTVYRLKSL